MLSHPRVDPEHLLLAAARYGEVENLLADEGIDARAIGVIDCVAVRAARPDRHLGYVGARRLRTVAVPREVGDRDALQLGDPPSLAGPLETLLGNRGDVTGVAR
jgi:hypothetical protein